MLSLSTFFGLETMSFSEYFVEYLPFYIVAIFRSSVPFESALYLCHGAFGFLDSDFFRRTSINGCFPLFIAVIIIVTLMTLYSVTLQCCDQGSGIAFFGLNEKITLFVLFDLYIFFQYLHLSAISGRKQFILLFSQYYVE